MTVAVPSADDPAAVRSLAQIFCAAGVDWIIPAWEAPPGVRGFVTTRNGGVSAGACASLDLGGSVAGSASVAAIAAIGENRRRVQAFLPSAPVWLQQVHGADVIVVDAQHDVATAHSAHAPGMRSRGPIADGAVTRAANVVLAVRIADCLPVLFADREATVIGIAHAGWRGLAAGVLERTLEAMRCDPARIVAWLGPAIGPQAFEVGTEVRDAFVDAHGDASHAFVETGPGKWLADLAALARTRLDRAGVARIGGGDMCTLSDPSRFFSFRRDGTAGRMAALLWREDVRE